MALPYKDFVHPADKKALDAMKAIPGFDALTKKLLEVLDEKSMKLTSNAHLIKLGPNQYPNIYEKLVKVADKLQIEVPSLFLSGQYDDVIIIGDTSVSIIIPSDLFWRYDDNNIEVLFAILCGHIVCHHTLYITLAIASLEGLIEGVDGLFLVKKAFQGLQAAVNYWYRCSLFSADRVAAYYFNSTKEITDYHAIEAGFRQYVPGKFNKDEFIAQGKYYREFLDESNKNKLLLLANPIKVNNPLLAARAYAVSEWFKEFDYNKYEEERLKENFKEITEGSDEKHQLQLMYRNAKVTGFKAIASKVRTTINKEKLHVSLNGVNVEIAPGFQWNKTLNQGKYNIVLKTHNQREEYKLYLNADTVVIVEWNDVDSIIQIKEKPLLTKQK